MADFTAGSLRASLNSIAPVTKKTEPVKRLASWYLGCVGFVFIQQEVVEMCHPSLYEKEKKDDLDVAEINYSLL